MHGPFSQNKLYMSSTLKTTQPGSIPLAGAAPAIPGAGQQQQMNRYRKKFVGLDPGILANQVKWH